MQIVTKSEFRFLFLMLTIISWVYNSDSFLVCCCFWRYSKNERGEALILVQWQSKGDFSDMGVVAGVTRKCFALWVAT